MANRRDNSSQVLWSAPSRPRGLQPWKSPGRVTVAFSKKSTAGVNSASTICSVCSGEECMCSHVLTTLTLSGCTALVTHWWVICRNDWLNLKIPFCYHSWFLWSRVQEGFAGHIFHAVAINGWLEQAEQMDVWSGWRWINSSLPWWSVCMGLLGLPHSMVASEGKGMLQASSWSRTSGGTSPMVQWLRHHLPVQGGVQVQSLIGELRSYMSCSQKTKK